MNFEDSRRLWGRWAATGVAWLAIAGATAWPKPGVAGMGDFDVRFGQRGVLEVERPGPVHLLELADGKLLVLGHPEAKVGHHDPSRLELRRYLPDGQVDAAFGQAGRLVVPTPGDNEPWVADAAVQPDGKILVSGSAGVGSEGWVRYIARMDSSGNLDPGFGSGGLVSGGWAGSGDLMFGVVNGYTRLAVLPDGDIVASISDPAGNYVDRYDRDGRRVSSRELAESPIALAALSGGDIVTLGQTDGGVRARRLRGDGTEDPTFGVGGVIDVRNWLGGQIAVTGVTQEILLCGGGEVRRLDVSGRPVTTFGAGGSGIVSLEPLLGMRPERCDGLLADDAGTIQVVASDVGGVNPVSIATVAVYLRHDGSLDPRFAAGRGYRKLRGLQAPDEQWHARGMFGSRDGNARMVWNYASSAVSGLRVEALDLGAGDAPGVVAFAPVRMRVRENAGLFEAEIIRSGRASGTTSIRYESAPGAAGAADFGAIQGTLSWTDGDGASRFLQVPIDDDALVEGEEDLVLRTFAAQGTLTPPEPVLVTIADDDALRALRFRDTQITWTMGPSIPNDAWPTWSLIRDDAAAGPVTAYFYMANGIDSCCVGAVAWGGGETGPRTIVPFPGAELGGLYYVTIVDEAWNDMGPYANVKVIKDPTPPNSGSGGSGGGSSGSGDSGGKSGSHGGGAMGLLDAVALACLALAGIWLRRRRVTGMAGLRFR